MVKVSKSQALVLVTLFVTWLYNYVQFLGLFTELKYTDGACNLVAPTGMVGSEDFCIGKHSNVFISQGDLHNCFIHGSFSASPGHIWFVNMKRKILPQKAIIENFPPGYRFQPHGIYVSNSTDLLYAVNHAQNYSGIEVFGIDYSDSPSSVTLKHLFTIKSNLFELYSINDVVEGAEKGEIFVTKWLPYGYPAGGKLHPVTPQERAKLGWALPINLMGMKFTNLYRCTWDESTGETECSVPKGTEKFGMANGITTSSDRTHIFVNDVVFKMIHVYNRGDPNDKTTLLKAHPIKLDFMGDNIEFDPVTEEIIYGSIPLPYVPVLNDLKKNYNEHKVVPGGMGVISPEFTISHPILHDGTKLSQISAASRYGNTVLLGSPFSNGILVCQI